jgi:PAT family beta-lactamase induction signal transducer AmpG
MRIRCLSPIIAVRRRPRIRRQFFMDSNGLTTQETTRPATSTAGGSPLTWVSSTYFTEKLPLMIVRKLSTVFFTDIGVNLRTIGYLNFLGNAWNLKFLWAPLLDLVGTKRRWLIVMQALVGILTLIIMFGAMRLHAYQSDLGLERLVVLLAPVFIIMAFISATNDVAIDAYYMEGIKDPREQAAYSGHRVMAYRVAIIYANFFLVVLAGLSTDKSVGWAISFGAAALTMLALASGHTLLLPRYESITTRPPIAEILFGFIRAFTTYLKQPRVYVVLVFIATYKADEMLFAMNTPFLMRELHVTKGQLAWLAGIVGAASTVCGAMLAGWWIKRVGFRKSIWPVTLLMNLSIWAYVWLAFMKPDGRVASGLATIALVNGYEHFAAGLGSTALIVYMLRTCRPEFKAAHFAIGTALMSIPANLLGGFAGRIVESVGWTNFFMLAFLATVPSMALIHWLPYKDESAIPPVSERP